MRVSRPRKNVHDVARMAGVSIATVSRTFNSPNSVREDLRARVIEAARTLDYAANPAAKALRSQKTRIVGAVIPTLDYAIFATMINSFQQTFSAHDYAVFVLTSGFDNTSLHKHAVKLIDRGAEALLFVGALLDPELESRLLAINMPTVSTYSFLHDQAIPSIGFDNRAAMREVVDHQLGLGHERLVFVAGPTKGNDRQLSRIEGFRHRLAERDVPAGIVLERPHTLEGGAGAMREIAARHPATTAVICSSDVLAFGALAECRKLGLAVPGDISLTGFDDADFAALLDPPLTTVSVPAAAMGERAAEALLHALASGAPIPPQRLATSLIVRGSTGRARKRAQARAASSGKRAPAEPTASG